MTDKLAQGQSDAILDEAWESDQPADEEIDRQYIEYQQELESRMALERAMTPEWQRVRLAEAMIEQIDLACGHISVTRLMLLLPIRQFTEDKPRARAVNETFFALFKWCSDNMLQATDPILQAAARDAIIAWRDDVA